MSTFIESGAMAGSCVRLMEHILPSGANSPREQFYVKEAPAHGNSGQVVLEGLLSKVLVYIGAEENAIAEVVE